MKCLLLILLSITFITTSSGQSFLKTMDKIPDTGQTKDFTNIYGEDSDYTINPLSYTNNNNGTISDNVTGLMWQQVDGGEMTIEKARQYVDTLTLAGYLDWRLPLPMESFSLLNHNNNNPAIERDYFISTGAQYWWTAVSQYNDENKIWVTNAGGGIGNHLKNETVSAGGTKRFHVRAVREIKKPNMIIERYTKRGDVVSDKATLLEWSIVSIPSTFTWEEALSYSENLNVEGYTDWRLPNIKELQSINDYSRSNPSCNTYFFPNTIVSKYWSSTSLTNQPISAWYWDTKFGISTYAEKTEKLNLICVRSGTLTNTINLEPQNNYIIQNPFQSYINIITNRIDLDYYLYDINGKEIFNGKHIENVDFSKLVIGLYFLKIVDNDCKKIHFYKMVKTGS